MAKPDRVGQLVRWLHYPPIMRIKGWADERMKDDNSSVFQSAFCEWLTTDGVYQKEKFPIAELELAELPPPAADQGK